MHRSSSRLTFGLALFKCTDNEKKLANVNALSPCMQVASRDSNDLRAFTRSIDATRAQLIDTHAMFELLFTLMRQSTKQNQGEEALHSRMSFYRNILNILTTDPVQPPPRDRVQVLFRNQYQADAWGYQHR